jgi:hypothetical protein
MNPDLYPVTVTMIQGHTLISQFIGSSLWHTAPLIHGCQPHYYHFPTWASVCEVHSDWFHVGMFVMPDEHLDSSYKAFVGSWNSCKFDFLLLDQCSRIFAWKIADEGEISKASLLPFEGGNIPPITNAVRDFLKSRYGAYSELVSPLYLHDKHEKRLKPIVPDFEVIDAQLKEFFAKNPHVLHYLHHRKFEEFLASLFEDLGYEVELGPGSGDRGVDLRLLMRTDTGPFLILVQAKKYAPHRPITLQPVQALFGAVEAEKASQGLLVSTSRFHPAAKRFAQEQPYRIQLAGPAEIQQWLLKVVKGHKGSPTSPMRK